MIRPYQIDLPIHKWVLTDILMGSSRQEEDKPQLHKTTLLLAYKLNKLKIFFVLSLFYKPLTCL